MSNSQTPVGEGNIYPSTRPLLTKQKPIEPTGSYAATNNRPAPRITPYAPNGTHSSDNGGVEERKQQLLGQISSMASEVANVSRVTRDVYNITTKHLQDSEKLIGQRLESNIQTFKSTANEINKTHSQIEEIIDEARKVYSTSDGSLGILASKIDKQSAELGILVAADSATKKKVENLNSSVEKQAERIADATKTLRVTAGDIQRLLEMENSRNTSRAPPTDRVVTDSLDHIKLNLAELNNNVTTKTVMNELRAAIATMKNETTSVLEKRSNEQKQQLDIIRSEISLLSDSVNTLLRATSDTKEIIEKGSSLVTDNKDLQRQMSLANEKTRTLEVQIGMVNEKLKLSDNEVITLRQKLQTTESLAASRNNEWVTKHKELEKKASDAITEASRYSSEVVALRIAAERLKGELDAMRQERASSPRKPHVATNRSDTTSTRQGQSHAPIFVDTDENAIEENDSLMNDVLADILINEQSEGIEHVPAPSNHSKLNDNVTQEESSTSPSVEEVPLTTPEESDDISVVALATETSVLTPPAPAPKTRGGRKVGAVTKTVRRTATKDH